MATNNNTITNKQIQQVLQAIHALNGENKELRIELKGDIRHTQHLIIGVGSVCVALFLFVLGLLWFVNGDVKNLQADVEVQQELANLRAQVQTLQSD